jgi:site-specific DNA recombinase
MPKPKAKLVQSDPTAVVYLRVSTKEQANRNGLAEGFSLPTQRQNAHDKARELGAVVVEEFVEAGKSAKTADRVELQRMLAFVEDNPVHYVIVYKVDRLIRNRMDDFVITMALDQAGVQLASCTEHIDNTAAGRFSHGLMALMANWYSDNLSEEIKNKGLAKVQSGGTVGKAPIGYLNVRQVVNGREARTVELDEKRAPIVRWAFESYASGEFSLSALTDAVQEKGLTTVPGPVMVEKPIPRSTLHRMLRNPYYVGYVRRNGVRYEGSHPALVSHETFDRVQELLDAQNVAGEKQRVHQHYLKGSVYCATCGSRLCITKAVNRHGSEYLYFFCLGNYHKFTNCDQRASPVELVESHIESKWQSVRFSPKYAETIKALVSEELSTARSQQREKSRALKRRAQLNEQRKKLLNAHYMDAIPLELLKDEQDRITREIAETDRQMASAEVGLDRVEAIMRRCLDFLVNCHATYVMASPKVRRQLNQAMFEAFYVGTDGALTAKPTEWFRQFLRTDALQPVSRSRRLTPASTDLHDSNQWQDGSPRWVIEEQAKQGQNRSDGSTPVFQGLGLNKGYLAEEVGFEPTDPCRSHDFQSCRFGRSRTPPGRAVACAWNAAAAHQGIVLARRCRAQWPGSAQLAAVNRVRVGRQQLSADQLVCRRGPGRCARRRLVLCPLPGSRPGSALPPDEHKRSVAPAHAEVTSGEPPVIIDAGDHRTLSPIGEVAGGYRRSADLDAAGIAGADWLAKVVDRSYFDCDGPSD